jgi:hypothetical protein
MLPLGPVLALMSYWHCRRLRLCWLLRLRVLWLSQGPTHPGMQGSPAALMCSAHPVLKAAPAGLQGQRR